jgi:hypothetical protein
MDLLRAKCGMGLKQAKQAVDDLLDGKEISIIELDDVKALGLREEIESLGAVCRKK